jgi:hypothetical protein
MPKTDPDDLIEFLDTLVDWEPLFPEDYGLNRTVKLFEYIRHQVIKRNEAWDLFLYAMRGKAKSSTALSLAMLLDPDFDLSRWCFTIEQWLEVTMEAANTKARGWAIVQDEMGTQKSMSSQNWYSQESKDAADIHQMNRTDGIMNIATSLEIGRVNNRMRSQFKIIAFPERKLSNFETGGRGMAVDVILRIVEQNPFEDDEKKSFERRYPRYADGGRITRVRVFHPPKEIWNAYSVRRAEFLSILREANSLGNQQAKYTDKMTSSSSQVNKVDANLAAVTNSLLKTSAI